MKKCLILLACNVSCLFAFSQNIGIGTVVPNANAILDIADTSKGILIPRMDSASRKAIPNVEGMLLYDKEAKSFFYNDGHKWNRVVSNIPAGIQDGDMLVWKANAWTLLSKPAGNNSVGLAYCNGIPVWGGCPLSVTTEYAARSNDTIIVKAGFTENAKPVLAAGVCYGTMDSLTVENSSFVNTPVYGLTPYSFFTKLLLPPLSARYYFRPFAVNPDGQISYGSEISYSPPSILYPNSQKLWVPGTYQNWNPAVAPQVVSANNDKKFEGYIYVGTPTNIKFLNGPDWNQGDWGGTAGQLIPGGNDLVLSSVGAGQVLLRANLNDSTWNYAGINKWSFTNVITNSDVNLTFNTGSGKWGAVVFLNAGDYKFRANNNWILNFGDDNTGDPSPDYDGAAIRLIQSRTYSIELDLTVPGNYKYSVL